MALRQLDDDLWVTETPLRFLGVEVGTRMTVVRLPGGRLLLHSPVPATPDLLREVQDLGSVEFLVAPNCFHHLFVGQWKEACPGAGIYVAPGLDRKRADLEIAGVLGDRPEPGWEDTIDQVLLAGVPMLNEVVMFHRPSATLLATDLAFNIGENAPAMTRLFIRFSGTFGELAPTLLERVIVRDRPAFRAGLERILAWPFERVVVSHGDVSEGGGREQLVRGYAWVLPKDRAG